jgi:O-antigen/teichoic acid export membrane protein
LSGLQEHGWMNALQITANTLRYGLGVAVLFWRADLVWFFAVQAAVAGIQTLAIRRVLWEMIADPTARQPAYQGAIFKRVWRFSLGMALTAVSSVLLANADRIALSKMMPTAELGKYAVAFTATGLLQMGVQPFYRAFFPRYAELVSIGDAKRLRDEYFKSCRLMATVIIPLGIIGLMFAPQLFHAWLGRDDKTIIQVFRLLLVAITCAGLMWLPGAFQQAHGRPGLHAAMILGALVLGAPIMVWGIKTYGTIGATAVWLLHGISGLTLELWIMHRRMLKGELLAWYRSILGLPLLITIPLASLSWWLMPYGLHRWGNLAWIGTTGVLVMAAILYHNLGETRRGILPVLTDLDGG